MRDDMIFNRVFVIAVTVFLMGMTLRAEEADSPNPGDRMLGDYFEAQTTRLAQQSLAGIEDLEDWKSRKERKRRRLLTMLGLSPMPEKTPLKPTITGRIDKEGYSVLKLHFQSMPRVYVTANLYLPAETDGPVPGVLYVCGHALRVKNGVSFGNKTAYHHHGVWFARHGYVCLIIDTIQRGEIQGIHHGTYSHGMWWWNSRGYTPAGIETWNSIRALDYLENRPEVDPERLGVTGRSGGGVYSWWLAAVDDRIKVAAPVAGMTDLKNHVLDGTVEGHCDCMFHVNTYRWGFPEIAALVAPRPLLICNSDQDSIFPLDGVMRLHNKVRGIYRMYEKRGNLGLVITPGPHRDTQDLRIPVFRWFNRHLKDETGLIETPAEKVFKPEQLKVFKTIPENERNTTIQESFVPEAGPFEVPEDQAAWARQVDRWMKALEERSFRGWPKESAPLEMELVNSVNQAEWSFSTYELTSQAPFRIRLYLLERRDPGENKSRVTFEVADDRRWSGWAHVLSQQFGEMKELPELKRASEADEDQARAFSDWMREYEAARAVALLTPRGLGYAGWKANPREQTHIRRRFMLLGQTLDGMQVWDIRRGLQALRRIGDFGSESLTLKGRGTMGVNLLYAALFEEGPFARLSLRAIPGSHHDGPQYLNVLRHLDIPQAMAMAAERIEIDLHDTDKEPWRYCEETASNLGWDDDQFEVH